MKKRRSLNKSSRALKYASNLVFVSLLYIGQLRKVEDSTFGRGPAGRNRRKRRIKRNTPRRMSFFEKTRRLGEGDLEPFLLFPLLNRGSSAFFLRRYPSLIVCLSGVAHLQRCKGEVVYEGVSEPTLKKLGLIARACFDHATPGL